MRRATALVVLLGGFACVATGQMPGPDAHVFGNLNVLQWAPSRTYHVENYKLRLHFDQAKGEVFGDEVLTLRPFGPHFRKFYLNSTELTIESVALDSPRALAPLMFSLQDNKLWITLDRDYEARDSLNIRIAYHGTPRFGLFFVNPTVEDRKRPREIYSQGESEFNQRWFPCWDYPNDMATSETITTVPDGQVVVSNGKLENVSHAGSETTYDWVERVPHSSYLISIAVGPWRKVADKYEDKPVDYYVPESTDDATARRAFHLTPDMIRFFSRATGVDYPYEQYAQTAVRNFVFGGQENVSATTLTENTLHDERAEQDYASTGLVAHELGQHWFGDLVQGRDWANIWLNEGFATYLEALYTQHHEGNDAFRFEIYKDQLAAQAQDRDDYVRAIVDRHYDDAMEMFDAITHEKGAAVLDMLRYLVDGSEAASHPASQDELLFRALRQYLVAHRANTADTSDLIEAIRSVTGLELDWFFREWVFQGGHPDYRVEASYDKEKKVEKVAVEQTQTVDAMTPAFDMPIELAFHRTNGESKKIQVRDNLKRQEFDVALDFEPDWVDFDPDDLIDKTAQFEQPLHAVIAEAENDPSMMSRLCAAEKLGAAAGGDEDARVNALAQVLSIDTFFGVRAAAAASLGKIGTPKAEAILLSDLRQPDSRVRTAVARALGNYSKDHAVYDALVDALHNDLSYAVEAVAAQDIGRSGGLQSFNVLQAEAETKPETHVMQATLAGLAATKDSRAVAILLAHAQPGVPERIRLSALAGLGTLKEMIERDHSDDLIAVIGAALHDSYLPIVEAGERLVGIYDLTQFQTDIEAAAQNAPLVMQRQLAQMVLKQLKRTGK
ncbi:MAG: M1 family metallopeptidase [Candidatus Acidiferrum sp.]